MLNNALKHYLLPGAPYFTEGAPKQYFISKQCATKTICDQTKKETFPMCDRVSYTDWKCAECCQGDRCNFYVTVRRIIFNFLSCGKMNLIKR